MQHSRVPNGKAFPDGNDRFGRGVPHLPNARAPLHARVCHPHPPTARGQYARAAPAAFASSRGRSVVVRRTFVSPDSAAAFHHDNGASERACVKTLVLLHFLLRILSVGAWWTTRAGAGGGRRSSTRQAGSGDERAGVGRSERAEVAGQRGWCRCTVCERCGARVDR